MFGFSIDRQLPPLPPPVPGRLVLDYADRQQTKKLVSMLELFPTSTPSADGNLPHTASKVLGHCENFNGVSVVVVADEYFKSQLLFSKTAGQGRAGQGRALAVAVAGRGRVAINFSECSGIFWTRKDANVSF